MGGHPAGALSGRRLTRPSLQGLGSGRLDPTPVVFGLVHTDPNQHANFLAYPSFAEDAALRRLRELGESTSVLARVMEVGYRKPSFAGETLGLVLQAFRWNGDLGIVAAFVDAPPSDGTFGSPRALRCALRARFR